jgi:7-cyano-7-deazaguanine synthase
MMDKNAMGSNGNSNKALVLLSGGIDSATCLYWAKSKGYDTYALTINYYNRWIKEIEASRVIAREAGVQLKEIDAPFIMEAFNIYGYSSPKYKSSDARWPFYIASKNLLFYSIAAHIAEYMNARWIIGGHIKEDMLFFKDASKEYIDTLNWLFKQGFMLNEPAEIILPLADLDKLGVVRLALELNVPLEHTWSCHLRVDEPCGKCNGCIARQEVFKIMGIRVR